MPFPPQHSSCNPLLHSRLFPWVKMNWTGFWSVALTTSTYGARPPPKPNRRTLLSRSCSPLLQSTGPMPFPSATVDSGPWSGVGSPPRKCSSTVYQPLGDINLDIGDPDVAYAAETYERELDLDTATATVKYTLGDVQFTREHFASNPHQVIVTRLSANVSGSLSFMVSLDSKLHHHSHVSGADRIIMEGSCPGKRIPPKANANENPKGIQFSAVLELRISDGAGTIKILDDKKLKVEGSSWAVLLLAASSSFDGPFTKPSDSKKDPTLASLDILNSIKNLSYSELYSHHLDDYQKLFHRVSLQLCNSSISAHEEQKLALCSDTHIKNPDACRTWVKGNGLQGWEKIMLSRISTEENNRGVVSTAERVKSFKDDEDPYLVALLFQYGRYLLISCSRARTQPSNLQGIWSKDIEPAWDGAPHLNINLQMNYWPALSCNLKECQEPLFDYISSLAINGSKTARVNYEASGWVAHQVSDIWAKTSPDRGDPVWALWQMGGAWLCTHLWEHYTYTLDKGFLESKAYPLLEGCASFLLDWLVEGHGGYLVTNPSTSPEHRFIAPDGKPASVSYSSTMDMAIIREIFSSVVSAAEVLGRTNDDLVEKVKKAQLRLYPTRITRDGSIMEWAQDFEDPEVHHRHISHLFGLFPGHTITLEKTPDLCKAAAYSLDKRGEEGPGWSTTWKTACWARLHSSEHAYRMIKHLIDLVDPDHEVDFEGGLYSNLFTAHPPFQIDANFGFAAAIAEMLVQSTEKDLYLLPALPRDKWASGCVKGLKARGGVTVNICWREGKLHEAGLWAENQNWQRRLHYNGTVSVFRFSAGTIYTLDGQLKCLKMCSL
ncbi:alpha-L-fucosidase 2-like isoform X2 [Magnolia sinica]|uniref:alpha-L-fucosidase 2-like isoform X2 n=1 Tax=Magnolia sinica TaxID=86752 RepID=UPI00265918C0|nr:alpha-L-fucosidase 2-like isoform X2 [Magnolia sinica]